MANPKLLEALIKQVLSAKKKDTFTRGLSSKKVDEAVIERFRDSSGDSLADARQQLRDFQGTDPLLETIEEQPRSLPRRALRPRKLPGGKE